ncbi:MAG: rhamnogalacturonan acetylesterase [Ignavibacteriales bacterium]|nr:rhamnogalacturonan acetylesterase [Ignavibacteriales bacterium]
MNINIPKRIIIFLLILSTGCSVRITDKKPTIFLIGDSTMADKPTEDNPERGWGQMFPEFFDGSVRIENHAKNGRSTRSFLFENRWKPITDRLIAGDYVFIQFGHNDQSKEKTDRYTPPEDFKKNLIKFVEETKNKQAQPILCTPIMRRRFDENGKFYDVHGVYPDIVREVAKEYNVPLIDMHRKSEKVIVEAGEEGSKKIFLWIKPGEYKSLPEGKEDNTHFSESGAKVMAELAVAGIKELKLGIADHLKK